MANKKFSGTIEAIARNGKNFKIGEQWFSVFKGVQMKGAQKGDDVEFEYAEKEVGGTTFYNVQGDLKITGSSGDAGGSGSSDSSTAGARSGAGRSVSEDARQKSIVRQNSLTQANTLFGSLGPEFADVGSTEEAVELILEMARKFEAYSSGAED